MANPVHHGRHEMWAVVFGDPGQQQLPSAREPECQSPIGNPSRLTDCGASATTSPTRYGVEATWCDPGQWTHRDKAGKPSINAKMRPRSATGPEIMAIGILLGVLVMMAAFAGVVIFGRKRGWL